MSTKMCCSQLIGLYLGAKDKKTLMSGEERI